MFCKSYFNPNYKCELQMCVNISSRGKISREFTLCNTHTYDYDSHILLHCETLLLERNNFFSYLIDLLDVETYVKFDTQDEQTMLSFLFGADTDFCTCLNLQTWETIILQFSLYVYTLRQHLIYVYQQ